VAADELVELHFPAQPRHLRLARLTASGVATDLGFTIDEIEELRLAVDEACALLIEHAPDAARVELTYQVDGDAIVIDGRCASSNGSSVAVDAVAEAVLKTTLDGYEVSADDGTNSFHLVKRVSGEE
jgi:serine/threonine-protein kinase RsbW